MFQFPQCFVDKGGGARVSPGLVQQSVAETGVHLLQNGGAEQKFLLVGGQTAEDLLGQIVEEVVLAAAEGGDEALGAGRVLALDGGEHDLDRGGPALGLVRQGGQGFGRQVRGVLAHPGLDLRRAEAQIPGPQLGQMAPCPQPGQGQRRVQPGGEDQVQPRRAVLQQKAHGLMHRRAGEVVIVLQHHGPRVGHGLNQFVDQHGQDLVQADGGVFADGQQSLGGLAKGGRPRFGHTAPAHGLDQTAQKDRWVIVRGVQLNHATAAAPSATTRSRNNVVLPYPAGAETRISRRWRWAVSHATKWGRAT